MRQYKGSRSRDALRAFAEAGYTEVAPLSFWSSPFSPVNRLKGFLLWLVLTAKVQAWRGEGLRRHWPCAAVCVGKV